MVLELPQKTTLESLYQISDQSIWFLIWVLKKERLWPDLTKEVLKIPFTAKKGYYLISNQKAFFMIKKHNKYHSIECGWFENGQLMWEHPWKDGKLDGVERALYKNGQLKMEGHWKDGKQDGIYYEWYSNGQLHFELYWKNGKLDGVERVWYENGQLKMERHWVNGQLVWKKHWRW